MIFIAVSPSLRKLHAEHHVRDAYDFWKRHRACAARGDEVGANVFRYLAIRYLRSAQSAGCVRGIAQVPWAISFVTLRGVAPQLLATLGSRARLLPLRFSPAVRPASQASPANTKCPARDRAFRVRVTQIGQAWNQIVPELQFLLLFGRGLELKQTEFGNTTGMG